MSLLALASPSRSLRRRPREADARRLLGLWATVLAGMLAVGCGGGDATTGRDGTADVAPADVAPADVAPADVALTDGNRDGDALPFLPGEDTSPAPDHTGSPSGDAPDAPDVGQPAIDQGYWRGVTRAFATTPYGNVAAVSCHNCYVALAASPELNLSLTLALLHEVQDAGADLLELDIKEENGVIRVDHDDDGGEEGPLLADVLADEGLRAGDQLLFIELKENTPTESFVEALLEQLVATGYPQTGRPVVLRAFAGPRRVALELAQTLLAEERFAAVRDLFRFHELYARGAASGLAALQGQMRAAQADGFHGIELNYRDAAFSAKLALAKELGLGVNVWTIPVTYGEVAVSALRERVDALTVDYPVGSTRARVEADNGLLLLDAAAQVAGAAELRYHTTGGTALLAPLGGEGQPTWTTGGAGEAFYGSALRFAQAAAQSLTFPDADNLPDGGYLATVAVRFATSSLADGETMALLNKSDAGGFALELHGEGGGTVLRFGVRVGADYVYATLDAARLDPGVSYVVTGAYDGDGGVRMWLDNDDAGVAVETVAGGVVTNDTPVVLGADPQGPDERRFFFDGDVQHVQLLRWGGSTAGAAGRPERR